MTQRRLLVVDFDPSTSRTFCRVLRKKGFQVDLASDGQQAIKKIKSAQYEGVLVSFSLPDMDGIDLLLFTKQSLPNAAQIIMSGYPSLGNSIRALEAGADALFAKPVYPDDLIKVIEEKLENAQKVMHSSRQNKEKNGFISN